MEDSQFVKPNANADSMCPKLSQCMCKPQEFTEDSTESVVELGVLKWPCKMMWQVITKARRERPTCNRS
jgi:hypothetical protein